MNAIWHGFSEGRAERPRVRNRREADESATRARGQVHPLNLIEACVNNVEPAVRGRHAERVRRAHVRGEVRPELRDVVWKIRYEQDGQSVAAAT